MEFSAMQATADLSWLLGCPSMIQSPEAFAFAGDIPDSIHWGPVERFLETRAAHRVGYYVEALYQAWLESRPEISALQHGIQVRREKETLGELDFLFRENGVARHLEVALKFYLYYPERAENGSQFVGPNATDSFERKRDRLLGKQLPFGKTFFPEVERSEHSVKGMIFYHREPAGKVILPEKMNPDHARGRWLREGELEEFLSEWEPGTSARVLKKPFWLAATGPDLPAEDLDGVVKAHFDQWDGPVFLALFREETEMERVFVMPDFWPAKSG